MGGEGGRILAPLVFDFLCMPKLCNGSTYIAEVIT